MKIYFFGSNLKTPLSESYSKVFDVLKKFKLNISSNLTHDESEESSIEKIARGGQMMLDQMDGIIIEGSTPNSEIGYLVAFAISRKKPVLFLIEKGKMLDPALKNILKDESNAKFLKMQYYTLNTLEKFILYFMRTIEGYVENEVPSIKFTLRVTPMIDRYLEWKTQDTDQTKAQFLRKRIVGDLIKKDDEYQEFLGHNFEEGGKE